MSDLGFTERDKEKAAAILEQHRKHGGTAKTANRLSHAEMTDLYQGWMTTTADGENMHVMKNGMSLCQCNIQKGECIEVDPQHYEWCDWCAKMAANTHK